MNFAEAKAAKFHREQERRRVKAGVIDRRPTHHVVFDAPPRMTWRHVAIAAVLFGIVLGLVLSFLLEGAPQGVAVFVTLALCLSTAPLSRVGR